MPIGTKRPTYRKLVSELARTVACLTVVHSNLDVPGRLRIKVRRAADRAAHVVNLARSGE